MAVKKDKKSIGPVLSLWALLAGSSIYKVLAVLAVMMLSEVLLFYHCLRGSVGAYTLAGAVQKSHISVVFLVSLGLVYLVLAWAEGRLDAKSSATMLRLRLSGSRIFMIKTAYNVTCMVILFVAQIWLGIWLVGMYGRVMTEIYASPQRLFLAFYRIDFLHSLLPMAEVGKWIRNLLMLLALGIGAAEGIGRSKNRNDSLITLYVTLSTVIWFTNSISGNMTDVICSIVYVIMIAFNIWQVRREQKA